MQNFIKIEQKISPDYDSPAFSVLKNQFRINISNDNRFQIEINQKIIVTDGFISLFHNDDWISSLEGKLTRKGVELRSNISSEYNGEWNQNIPSCIAIGEGQYTLPDFRVWFEYQINGLDSPLYLLIDGFHEKKIIFLHVFWESPTKSDTITGFLNIGQPPIAECSENSINSTNSSILAFGNYHNNEESGELLILKSGMEVWSTAHYASNWDALKSRPPICVMIARAASHEKESESGLIGWMTVNKWGARSVIHANKSIVPELFGQGLKVIATKNHKGSLHQHLPGVIIGLGTQPRVLMNNLSDLLASIVCRPEILRKNKHFPEVFDYLGWCTWNGLGERRFLSGDRIVEFWRLWAEKYSDIPFRMMIIDDGWQYVEKVLDRVNGTEKNTSAMTKFIPNNKFSPFSTLRQQIIKIAPNFKYLGVWHTINGWWGGIAVPGYPLLPNTSRMIDVRPYKSIPISFSGLSAYLPDPVSKSPENPSMQFYNDWYKYLKQEGVDFTKVDSQNALNACLNADNEPDAQKGLIQVDYASRALHQAKESASKTQNMPSINCMCMVPTSWQHWTGSAVSRCSGDFCSGDVRYSSFLMHQAALNLLWYSNFVWGDWDMWNSNEDLPHLSEGMAICRAISGGPIYVTDYPDFMANLAEEREAPGDWLLTTPGLNTKLLRKLAHPITGQVARFLEPAQPNFYSLWHDSRIPDSNLTRLIPLVINNKIHVAGYGTVGYVAIVNVSAATNRVNMHNNSPKSMRDEVVKWNAPSRTCSVTRDMLIDAPEFSAGVELSTEKIVVHQISTSNIHKIHGKNDLRDKSVHDELFSLDITLNPMQAAYFQVIPLKTKIVPLGTPELFNQMWVFESIVMANQSITMKLKFAASIQLYHTETPPAVENVIVGDANGKIPFRKFVPINTYWENAQDLPFWTRNGSIDTIYSNSLIVNYFINK